MRVKCLLLSLLLLISHGRAQTRPRLSNPSTPAPEPNRPAPTPTRPVPRAASAPKFALLVGLSQYQGNFPKLSGAQEAQQLKKILIQRFGWPDDNAHLRVLTDANATGNNIRAAFQEMLIDNARRYPEGVFLFYFSGHGSRVLDADCDEPDGWDESIVPYDSRDTGNKNFDIIDDEIGAWVKQVSESTRNAFYIFDSCHSGTANRGTTVRQIPDDTRLQPVRRCPRAGRQVASGDDRYLLPDGQDYVLLTACRSDEKARQTADDKWGALSRSLFSALNATDATTTYQELFDRLAPAVWRNRQDQHPQLTGDASQRVLNGTASPAAAYLPIVPRSLTNNALTTAGGAADGLTTGAYVAVYDAQATRLVGSTHRKALGQVTQLAEATAVITLGEIVRPIAENDKVALVSPLFGTERLRVGLPPPTDETARRVRRELAQILSDDDLLTPAPEEVAVTVRYGRQDEAFSGARPLLETQDAARLGQRVPLTQQRGFYLTDTSGEPLFGLFVPADTPEAARVLWEGLTKLAQQNNLAALENRTAPLNGAARQFKLQFRRLPADDAARREVYRRNAGTKINPEALALGDRYYVELLNPTQDATLYAYLLLLSTDGAIYLMSPTPAACELAQAVAPAASVQSLPFQSKPPLGQQRLKLIVTNQPVTQLCFLTQGKATDGASRQGLISPLEMLLKQAVTGTVAPRNGLSAPGWDSWGTADFVLNVPTKTKP